MPQSLNPSKLERTAKAWVTVLFGVLTALAGAALPDPFNKWVALALLVVTPVVVYLTPNASTTAPFSHDSVNGEQPPL